VEAFRLKMILRLLKISSFSGKMNALNEVGYLAPLGGDWSLHLVCFVLVP